MATKENPFSDPKTLCIKKGGSGQVLKATPAIIARSKGKLIACDANGKPLGKPGKGKTTKAPAKAETETSGETDGEDGGEEPKSDRAALEAEAKKLGISFRPNVKDETLRKKIEAAKA